MTQQEIRLECLRLALPRDLANPDIELIVKRAMAFEAYVAGDGHAKAPSQPPALSPQKSGHTGSYQSRRS
jgi:hypothetical protein